jgi:hypothetical protein
VFLFKWKGKAVDNGSKDFQKLRNSVEPLGLIAELEKDVVDRSANI